MGLIGYNLGMEFPYAARFRRSHIDQYNTDSFFLHVVRMDGSFVKMMFKNDDPIMVVERLNNVILTCITPYGKFGVFEHQLETEDGVGRCAGSE